MYVILTDYYKKIIAWKQIEYIYIILLIWKLKNNVDGECSLINSKDYLSKQNIVLQQI